MSSNYPTDDRGVAAFWGVAFRTVFRWKGDGAPLNDYDEMLRWLSTRKNLPRAVLAKIKLPPAKNVSSPVTAGTAGAAAALKRLEGAEIAAWNRHMAALDRGNLIETREARDSWLKISESLRKFDLLVEQNRREAGELIPRETLENFIKLFLRFSRTTFTLEAQDLVSKLVGAGEVEIYQTLRGAMNVAFYTGTVRFMAGNFDPGLIATAKRSIEETFQYDLSKLDGDVERLKRVIQLMKEENL